MSKLCKVYKGFSFKKVKLEDYESFALTGVVDDSQK